MILGNSQIRRNTVHFCSIPGVLTFPSGLLILIVGKYQYDAWHTAIVGVFLATCSIHRQKRGEADKYKCSNSVEPVAWQVRGDGLAPAGHGLHRDTSVGSRVPWLSDSHSQARSPVSVPGGRGSTRRSGRRLGREDNDGTEAKAAAAAAWVGPALEADRLTRASGAPQQTGNRLVRLPCDSEWLGLRVVVCRRRRPAWWASKPRNRR